MKIQVVGAGCEKCSRLYENVIQAVDHIGIEAEITKVEDLLEIVKLGVMTTPTLLIDGSPAASGTASTVQKIEKCIRKSISID